MIVRLSAAEMERVKREANYYSDIGVKSLDRMAEVYSHDCCKLDIADMVALAPLIQVYVDAKQGVITTAEAIRRQRGVFEIIEIEE